MINDKKVDITKGIIMTIIGVTCILLFIFHGNFDINYPIIYAGGDETSYMSEIKMLLDNGSFLEGDQIAAPFGTNRRGDMSYYLFNDVHIISYLFAKLTGNVAFAVNLTYFVLFYFNSITAFCVMIVRKINWLISSIGAILFSCLPYVFLRGTPHIMLSAMYTIPLAILICLWIWEDDNFLKLNKNFLKYKKNYIFILMAFILVNSGIGYYTAFSCLLILVSGISATLYNKNSDGFKRAISAIGIVIIQFTICISGFLIYTFKSNASHTTIRSIGDVEQYCLKIARLFIPTFGTGIEKIDNVFNEYSQVAVCQTETSEYIGLFGTLGFVILIIVLFMKNDTLKNHEQLILMSQLVIVSLLYSTIGGFEVFVFFITDMARCTNRISIFIAFICIYSLCYYFSYILEKIKSKKIRITYTLGILLLSILSLKFQIPIGGIDNIESKKTYQEISGFVSNISERVGKDAMIFQLPVQQYPTGPLVNNMYPNALFMPYIVSDGLKWSYGGLPDEKSYLWGEKISQYDSPQFIDTLCFAGFSGIYIDTFAYGEEELNLLENQIEGVIDCNDKIVSESRRWIFYDLSNYSLNLKDTFDEQTLENFRKAALE